MDDRAGVEVIVFAAFEAGKFDYTLSGNFPVFKKRSLSLYDNNLSRFARLIFHRQNLLASVVDEAVGSRAYSRLRVFFGNRALAGYFNLMTTMLRSFALVVLICCACLRCTSLEISAAAACLL